MASSENLVHVRRARSEGAIRRPEMVHLHTHLPVHDNLEGRQGLYHTVDNSGLALNSIATPSLREPYIDLHQPSVRPSPAGSGAPFDTASPPLITPPPQTPLPAHPEQPDLLVPPQHNTSIYVRCLNYFGLGRRASHARKALVSVVWNLSWGFFQVVTIVTILILTGTRLKSPTQPELTEWKACDRPLGIWASIWVVRAILASGLAYWDFRRDRLLRPSVDAESGNVNAAALPQDVSVAA
ncbi:unnamed protein product [Cyclocybe aegerita]|uniref:Uncharacterized protein n=1 Tax=Cyclocybe aegerita TaxID=1973307 RepID=A0A8S0WQT3_CYCAE|nr:unnamed protein product [Cyclocybe aegerita]